MEKFNKSNLNTIRKDLEKALAEVSKKHNIGLEIGNISFENSKFTTKLTATIGDGSEYERSNFERKSFIYDMPKGWYGKTFTSNGQTFEITGINTRASKSPINFRDIKTQGNYKGTPDFVKSA